MNELAPSFHEYVPELKWQRELVKDIWELNDYSKGVHTHVCSGTVGSGKSIQGAHLGIMHLLEYSRARCLIARKALPDLKDTLYQEIIDLLDDEYLVEGKHYFLNDTKAKVRFSNNSEFLGRSWSDRKYKKLGSLKLSAAIIEEGAENDDEDKKAFEFIHMRVGRLPHVPQNFVIINTNPDSPDHFIYTDYIDSKNPLIKTYYSHLKDNPFLPKTYYENLARQMDPKLALRMLEGQWVEIYGEVVYHQYRKERNYRDHSYQVQAYFPIRISFDFNIGEGKPMSVSVIQIDANQHMHIFNEVVIEGMRTEDAMEELAGRGLLEYPQKYIINGDATGRHNDTRGKGDDYEIIQKYLDNYKQKSGGYIDYEIRVARSNPPVRKRHNKVNAWCYNVLGESKLFVYKDAPTADKGLRLTKLKDKGQYIEDDSKAFQHISTTIGYCLVEYLETLDVPEIGMYAR